MERPPPFDPEILATHVDFVRRLARGLVRGADAADELAADALAAAVAQRPQTGPAFRGWLRRVAGRLARRRVVADERRLQREQAVARPEREPASGELVAQIELERDLALAFTALAEPYRSTLFRRFWLDLTPMQIAEQTATPLPTVKSRLQRGLEQLRERLDAAHRGGREAWMGALVPWLATGGAIVATTVTLKSKLAAIAVAAVVLASASLVLLEPWKRGAQDGAAGSMALPSPAMAESVAASDGSRLDGASGPDAASAAVRALDPSALPFAAGVVVDGSGAPIADVAVVLHRMGRVADPAARDGLRNAAIGFQPEWAERDTLAKSDAAGRFRVAKPDALFVGFWFVRPGFALADGYELDADPAANQELRVVLPPARAVRGCVRDGDGSPVPGATIAIRPAAMRLVETAGRSQPDEVKRVARHLAGAPEYVTFAEIAAIQHGRTGADGRFDLATVPSGEGRLHGSAHARGYASVEVDEMPQPWEPVLTRTDLVIDVVDADTQEPIPGACAIVVGRTSGIVQMVANPETELVGGETRRTGSRLTVSVNYPRGGLTWLLIAPDQTVDATIHVAAVGYHSESVDTPITAKVEPPRLRVELVPDAEGEGEPSIAGRVVGPPGCEVALYAVQAAVHGIDPGDLLRFAPHLQTECAADGSFAFPHLPDASYLVVAKAKGCAPVRADVTSPRRDLLLTLDMAVSLDVVVTDGGKPVNDAIVLVQDESAKNAWSKRTSADGKVSFAALPMGKLRALAVAGDGPPRGFFPDRERASPLAATLFAADEIVDATAGASLKLELHPVARRPVKLHFQHDDGSAVTRIEHSLSAERERDIAQLLQRENERLGSLAIDPDGRGDAVVELFPGHYQLVAEEGHGRESTGIEVPRSGEASATIRLPDVRPTGTLRGRVVELGSETPVVARDVKLFSMRTKSNSVTVGTRTTDADGRFEFDEVPRGDVVLWIQGDRVGAGNDDDRPDPTSPYGFAEYRTRVEAGRDATVEIELPPLKSKTVALPTLALDARVLDAATGAPLEGATLDVQVQRGDTRLAVASLTTDADGRAHADVFAAEHYRVWVSGKPDPATLKSAYQYVTLELTPRDGVLVVEAELKKRE